MIAVLSEVICHQRCYCYWWWWSYSCFYVFLFYHVVIYFSLQKYDLPPSKSANLSGNEWSSDPNKPTDEKQANDITNGNVGPTYDDSSPNDVKLEIQQGVENRAYSADGALENGVVNTRL